MARLNAAGVAVSCLLVLVATGAAAPGPKKARKRVRPGKPAAAQIVRDVTVTEAAAFLELDPSNKARAQPPSGGIVVLDVRTPEEYAAGHIENAVNLDFHSKTFREALTRLDREKAYLVHCAVGGRSAKAASLMKKLGFRETYNLLGGIKAWKARGLPIVAGPGESPRSRPKSAAP